MNRLELNGVTSPRKSVRKPVTITGRSDGLYAYAMGGVGLMAVLSALLNGHANAQHATRAWAGWEVDPILWTIFSEV